MNNREKAEALVKAWVDQWTREGRLDGGLDRYARADLTGRIEEALKGAQAKPSQKKAAKTDG